MEKSNITLDKRLTIKLDSDLLKAISDKCKKDCVNRSELIRKLLTDWLNNDKFGEDEWREDGTSCVNCEVVY